MDQSTLLSGEKQKKSRCFEGTVICMIPTDRFGVVVTLSLPSPSKEEVMFSISKYNIAGMKAGYSGKFDLQHAPGSRIQGGLYWSCKSFKLINISQELSASCEQNKTTPSSLTKGPSFD